MRVIKNSSGCNIFSYSIYFSHLLDWMHSGHHLEPEIKFVKAWLIRCARYKAGAVFDYSIKRYSGVHVF